MSNLLRLIHTMKPPKKKKKKKNEGEDSVSIETSQVTDPILEKRKKTFPGLSIPDEPEKSKELLLKQPGDVEAANEALNEVSE